MRRHGSPINKSDNLRKDWRKVNAANAAVASATLEVRRLRRQVARNMRNPFVDDREPFEVYAKINHFRSRENQSADAWRTMMVRDGRVDYFDCANTDGVSGFVTLPEEILVPTEGYPDMDDPRFYIWVGADYGSEGPTMCNIFWGVEPWDGYPMQGSDRFTRLLATVDVVTHLATERALIVHYWTGHIFTDGQDARWA